MSYAITASEPKRPPFHLLSALLAHEQAAWTEFESWATPRLQGYGRQCGLTTPDAEAVSQQVLLLVYRRLERFPPERGPDGFRRWLFRIARNQVADLRRQERPLLFDPEVFDHWSAADASDAPTATTSGQKNERFWAAAQEVRAEFGELAWRAFWLVATEGWTAAQAGAEVGMTPSAVRMAKCRMLKRLRELVGDGRSRAEAGSAFFGCAFPSL